MKPHRHPTWLLVLIPLLALASCGEGAPIEAAAPLRQESALQLPRNTEDEIRRSFALAEWVDGVSSLAVTGAGSGRGIVVAELEDQTRLPLLEFDSNGETVSSEARLPGEGGRAVRLHFNALGQFRWLGARCLSSPPPSEASPLAGELKGRNVVILLTDALHAERMSCYGNERPTTPNLDRLAADGVRFETAYSQTSWTLPSIASLFTSLEQERHGVTHLEAKLSSAPTTLAESFRAAGYRTIGLVQNGIVWPQTGLDRGFDRYELFEWKPESFVELIAAARSILLAEDEAPLFLYLHLIPPHGPFNHPAQFESRFDPEYAGEIDGGVSSAVSIAKRQLASDHADVVQFKALYDEYLAYADDQLGQLIGGVQAAGKAQEYLFVHLSDHGEAFMQHGALGHAVHVYEEQVRIPMILSAPGSALTSGSVVSRPVSLLDLYPTLVELCDLPEPASTLQGRSLAQVLAGQEQTWTRPFFISSRYRGNSPSKQVALRLGGYKLVVTRSSTQWEAELFNLSLDPFEQHDLSQELPLLCETMEGMLRDWLARSPTGPAPGPETESSLDQRVRTQLRAIGYLSGDE